MVYPAGGSGKRFDELAWYAERFGTVEVNVSFYRPLTEQLTRGWVQRTPRGFEFAVKLHQQFTHAGGAGPTTGVGGRGAPELAGHAIGAFEQSVAPLAEAGRLGPLLAQFPASFHATPETEDYLAWLLDALHDHQVAVELRHKSWSDRRGETLRLLDAAGAAWTLIDEPKFSTSVVQSVAIARHDLQARPWSYVRLHGRNAASWWNARESEDRYQYLYADEELAPFAEIAEAARALGRTMYLYTNNHFAGSAVANAAQLRARLGDPVRGRFPRTFTERFPQVQGIVEAEEESDGRLF